MARRSTLILLLMAAASSVVLFAVKYRVQELESDLYAIDRRIAEEHRDIKALTAEWSHVNEPRRLQFLAERYLGLSPVRPERVVQDTNMDARLPLRPTTLESGEKPQ